MKPLYAGILLGALLIAATITLTLCSTGEAPPGFDPTRWGPGLEDD